VSAPAPEPAAASVSAPDAEFREAMAAFDGGDEREAAARFAAFVARHPTHPRAEDAAYLRVIALQRCGDRAGLTEAAGDYLRRYPAGFRRTEVEAVSR
jgi:outer membrane protein assembly factor BamD (BamD/ComL family)